MPPVAVRPENVAPFILYLRGEKVLLSEHLAELYAVPVKALNQAVKRNPGRLPSSTHARGSECCLAFKVTVCDLEVGSEHPVRPLCIYGARHCDAVERAAIAAHG